MYVDKMANRAHGKDTRQQSHIGGEKEGRHLWPHAFFAQKAALSAELLLSWEIQVMTPLTPSIFFVVVLVKTKPADL